MAETHSIEVTLDEGHMECSIQSNELKLAEMLYRYATKNNVCKAVLCSVIKGQDVEVKESDIHAIGGGAVHFKLTHNEETFQVQQSGEPETLTAIFIFLIQRDQHLKRSFELAHTAFHLLGEDLEEDLKDFMAFMKGGLKHAKNQTEIEALLRQYKNGQI